MSFNDSTDDENATAFRLRQFVSTANAPIIFGTDANGIVNEW